MSVQSEVEITLGHGEKAKVETLRASLRAARIVNGLAGNFVDVMRRLATFDLETYVAVTAAGLGKKPSEVEELVFSTGLTKLSDPLSNFVLMLSNGGRPPALTADEDAVAGEG